MQISFIFGLAIYGIVWFLTLFMVQAWRKQMSQNCK